MSESLKVPQFVASLASCIGSLMAGIAFGWSSPVQSEIESGALGFEVSDDKFSWVAAMVPLGAAFGCIPAGFLINIIGRKTVLCIMPGILAIGWLLVQYAQHIAMLYTGRLIVGIGCGAVYAAAPAYIAEISQKEIRGILGSFFQLTMTFGAFLVYLLGTFLKFKPLNYCILAICIVQLIIMIFMPESPAYLIEKDQEARAVKSMEFLRGKNYNAKPELDAIKAEFVGRMAMSGSFLSKLNNRACFRAFYITMGLMVIQQFSGIKAIIFYGTTMFATAGIPIEPHLSQLIIGTIGFMATLICGFFVDRLGRRLLLLCSSIFMSLTTFVFGLFFYCHEEDLDWFRDYNWVPLFAICLYYITYSWGFGTVPWILIGELFATELRGPVGAIASTTNSLLAFTVGKSYVSIKDAIGVGITFFIFAGISFIGIIFVFVFLPETKGKSLQEIQDLLSKKKIDVVDAKSSQPSGDVR